jgi:hypothetical protein
VTKRDIGIRVHNAIDACANGREAVVNDAAELALVNYGYKYLTEELKPRFESIKHEQAVAINFKNGEAKLLKEVKSRGYPDLGPDWVCGTADLVCLQHDDPGGCTLYVGDWKTGGDAGAEEQLLSLLYGFRKAFEAEEGLVPTRMLTSCLSLNEHGCWPNEREVTEEELQVHFNMMAHVFHELSFPLDYGVKEAVPGIHCTTLYCPHLAYCSAITDVVDGLAEGTQGLLKAEHLDRRMRLTDKPKDMKEAAYVMERLTAAKRQLNYLVDCMKEYVSKGGRVISGGMEWSQGNDGFRWRKVKDSGRG